MEEIIKYIVLFAIHAAAVCALFAILFVNVAHRWPMRTLTIALGAVAIALPVYSMYGTLGHPDPWPEPGHYEVVGWKFDEARRSIYVFVKPDGETRPRHYKVRFDLQTALDLQTARANAGHVKRIGMTVAPPEDGNDSRIKFDFEMKRVIRNPAEVAAEARWEADRQAQLDQEAQEEAEYDEQKANPDKK